MSGKKTKINSPTASPLEPLERSLYMKLRDLRTMLENKNLVVAVSGGLDSVVLLNALHNLSGRINYKINVVHINHGVRGTESDRDEKFVKEFAKSLGVPVTSKKLTNTDFKSSENNLRQLRYHILIAAKNKLKASAIVTAHHRDDLIETRLMRLLQGTGIHGLKSMTLLSSEGVMRPLLEMSRRDIEIYAKKTKLHWRNDSTNSDTSKLRNWIRRNWLSRLRMDHPGYVDSLYVSLERLVRAGEQSEINSITETFIINKEDLRDESIYSFLRHNTRERVTSRHVMEFKKRILTQRKKFSFRLAGQDWNVENLRVTAAP